jgi:hypothetical protein
MPHVPSYWKTLVLALAVLIALWVLLNVQYGSLPPFLLPL